MGLPSPTSWPIAALGISSKTSPLQLQPGGQLVLDNVRQERKDEWRTRSGYGHNAADDLPGANVPVICTQAPWGGLVGLCRETTAETACRIYARDTLPRWSLPPVQTFSSGDPQQSCSQQSPGIWERTPVAPVTGDGVRAISSAEGGGYRLTAWWGAANAGPAVLGFSVSLTSTSGASISSFQQFNLSPTAMRPRCVYSPVANQLVLFWADIAANRIFAFRWDTTTGLPFGLGTTTILATNCNGADPYIDAIWYGGDTITIAYRDNVGTGAVRQLEYNPTTNATTAFAPGVDCANSLSLFPEPDASGVRYIGVCTSTPEVRVLRVTSAGAVLTNHLVEAVHAENIAGCAYNNGTEWSVVYSGVSGTFLHACRRVAGTTLPVYNYGSPGIVKLATNAWREAGCDAMHFLIFTTGKLIGALVDDVQPTYLEMALPWNSLTAALNDWSEPQARILVLNAAGTSIQPGALPQVFQSGQGRFVTALGRITKQIDTPAGQDIAVAVDAWSVQYLSEQPAIAGVNQGMGCVTDQDAFLPAGNLLHTATGARPCTLGGSAIPYGVTLAPGVSGGGGLVPGKTYRYKVTSTLTDEAGNEIQSPASIVGNISGDIGVLTLPGGDNAITVDAYCTPFENATRLRTVKFWRTDGDGSTYKLLYSIADTIANTLHVQFVDATTDSNAGEIFTGEAQAGIVPSMVHVAVWNGRMWGADRDFPTRLRFTKPFTAGLLPQFVLDPDTGLEFVVDLDDQYGPITGLASLDSNLVVFKERATYVVSGDGPDNAGNGAFPTVNRISSETGSIPGAPLVSTGREVYIVSAGGIFRVSGAQGIDFVGAAIDKYLSMPLLQSPETVIGMVVSPGKNEVRIQTTNFRFVHDRIFNVWIRDTGESTFRIAQTIMLGGTTEALLTLDGPMYVEAADSAVVADAGVAYSGTIRHAWVRSAGLDGWIRFFKGRVLGEVTQGGGTLQPTLTVFFDNDDTIFETFAPRAALGAVAGPIRAEAQTRRQKCSAFSMQLTLPAGDATMRLDAWSVTAVPLGAAQPLASGTKWASQ